MGSGGQSSSGFGTQIAHGLCQPVVYTVTFSYLQTMSLTHKLKIKMGIAMGKLLSFLFVLNNLNTVLERQKAPH